MYAELTVALNMTGKDHQSHISGYGRRESTPAADYLLRGYAVARSAATRVAIITEIVIKTIVNNTVIRYYNFVFRYLSTT